MRVAAKYALFLILLGAWGCSQKGAKLQTSVVPPDRTLFETGKDYLAKSQYIKARLAFQTLISTYPDSDLTADSYLSVGDSFYNDGGTENLLQAEDQYKNFIVFFPTSPKAADAQMKIVSLNMKMMRAPDRDQQYTKKAEAAIRKMLSDFPDSDYVPIAKQFLDEVQENLARGDFEIGEFYAAKKKNYAGAKSRFKEIVEKYPNYSEIPEALFMLADTSEKTESSEEAARYYAKIVSEYPFSTRAQEAKARLEKLGKPVPEVNTQIAAQNQAQVKPAEGFSPLRPIISFVEAIKGPPDRFEAAKKTLEIAKTETASQDEKSKDGILIQTTLTKDASGKTRDATVLGSDGGKKTDATTTSAIKTKLAGDRAIQALGINVDTVDGNVTLTGTVNSATEAEKAVSLAKSVKGVKSVTPRLTVKSSLEQSGQKPNQNSAGNR